MKKTLTLIIISLLCLSAFSIFSPSVHALVTVMPTRLPQGIQGAASVWDGTNAYIFGGSSHVAGPFNHILRYNPSTGSISSMSAVLPDPVVDFPAVWTGQYVYLFGGYVAPLHTSDKIVRYNPLTDAITVMSAKLPTYAFPLYSMSAIWDGNYAYLFGGYDGYSYYDHILKYDPVNDQITVTGARLPTGIKWTSAVWSGTYAYIFGGRTAYGVSDEIARYDPAYDLITVMSAKLPLGIFVSSAVWAGTYAYIFGGSDIYNQELSGILRYDHASDSITTVEDLPSPRRWTCAVWDGSSAYIFGGEDSESRDLDEIVRFSPAIPATVDINPDTLNLKSRGRWITAYIELPEDYDVNDIDISSILLNDTILVDPSAPTSIGDYDSDAIPDLMVKFNRTEVISYILNNINIIELVQERFMTVTLTIAGYLNDGTPFQGSDTIKIILPTPRRYRATPI